MYYNEWENIIRDRLRNYNIWTARVNTLEGQISEIAGQLRLEAAPKTTRFGYDSFGGGWDQAFTGRSGLPAERNPGKAG